MCVYEYIFGTRVYILIVTIIYILILNIIYGFNNIHVCAYIYMSKNIPVWSKNFNNSFATIFFFIGDNNLLIHIILLMKKRFLSSRNENIHITSSIFIHVFIFTAYIHTVLFWDTKVFFNAFNTINCFTY